MDKKIVLEAKEITIGYKNGRKGNAIIHQNLSFVLTAGQMVCLLGSNGAGKSTLLRTLASTQPLLGGELLLNESPMDEYSTMEKAHLIGLVLTDKTTAGGLTVRELVSLGRQPYTGFFGSLSDHDIELVEQAIQAVGIAHKGDSYMAQLSDGERQKVMIAKALSQQCPLILLDEPTAFLDVASRIEIFSLLRSLAKDFNKTILLSTHDVEQALLLADQLFLLSPQGGIKCGVPEDLVLNGHIGNLFRHESLFFDQSAGIFRPNLSSTCHTLAVMAQEPYLFWVINALHRIGISHQPYDGSQSTYVKVNSANSIELHERERGVAYFNSFELFLSSIKERF